MIDITHFSYYIIFVWIVSFFIMEFPMRYLYLNGMGGDNLTKWYSFEEFNIYSVIIGDLFYVLLGIIIAYRIYNYLFGNERNLLNFFLVFLSVQICGDLLFYIFIKYALPENINNRWISFFRNYGDTAGLSAVFGDSFYILVWFFTALLIKDIESDILLALLFFYIFVCSIINEK